MTTIWWFDSEREHHNMPDLIDEKTKNDLREALKDLESDVKVVFFGRKKGCPG
jgi:hypothetical protein